VNLSNEVTIFVILSKQYVDNRELML